jgi:hypothetical protein
MSGDFDRGLAVGAAALDDAEESGVGMVLQGLLNNLGGLAYLTDAARGIVALKADLTEHCSASVRQVRQKFDIRGVPTIVFIGKNGEEREELRAVEFIDKHEFLERLGHIGAMESQ